jgi:histidyl-tRNA synthetase
MRLADRFEAQYCLLLGQIEVKENTIILRNMSEGKQKQIPFDQAIPEILALLGEQKLDTYSLTDHLGEFADPEA